MKKKDLRSNYLSKERQKFLVWLEVRFELFMIIVAIIWVLLLIGITFFKSYYLIFFFMLSWMIIAGDFLLKFLLAPIKSFFLRQNYLLVIGLLIPPIRIVNYKRIRRTHWTHFFLIKQQNKKKNRKYYKK
jgi:hypothetical protein